jgi:hypothetical protein
MMEQLLFVVLQPMVAKLTEYFLDKRRGSVTIAELQNQVLQLLAAQRDLQIEVTKARLAVIALSRYLSLTHQEIFLLRGESLELAVAEQDHRQALVAPAIRDFNQSVQARLARQSNQSMTRGDDSCKTRAALPSRPEAGQSAPDALSEFFDGFEEEIMRARLGGNK